MLEYPKINSLWKREGWYFDEKEKKDTSIEKQAHRQSFIIGDYAEPEFGNVKKWHVEEKVDGTNIRIMFTDGRVLIGGRTKDSQIPCHLLKYLQETFYTSLFHKAFYRENELYPDVILYGEGYGPKIQAGGGNYRKEPGFILFDVYVDGWWLKRSDVYNIAEQFMIPSCPQIGILSEQEIVEFVKSKPLSRCSETPQMMEGVICRSDPLMLFRNGKPMMWKLKCREFI